ncbi:MAG: SPOR domain-containing protein [Acidobacteriaceae bacterium]
MRDLEEDLDSTEITLGTGKLLGLFLGLVVICAIFFSLGYALGKNSGNVQPQLTEAAATPPPGATTAPESKPGAGASNVSSADLPSEPAAVTAAAKPSAEFTPAAARDAQTAASGIVVQVAAVSRRADAEILIHALRKKNYPVFLADNGSGNDKLFHVQVGPFSNLKEAELTKGRLAGDGYTPILKR